MTTASPQNGFSEMGLRQRINDVEFLEILRNLPNSFATASREFQLKNTSTETLQKIVGSPEYAEKSAYFQQTVCPSGRMYELSAYRFMIIFAALVAQKMQESSAEFRERCQDYLRVAKISAHTGEIAVGPDELSAALFLNSMPQQGNIGGFSEFPQKKSTTPDSETSESTATIFQGAFAQNFLNAAALCNALFLATHSTPKITPTEMKSRLLVGKNGTAPKLEQRSVTVETESETEIPNLKNKKSPTSAPAQKNEPNTGDPNEFRQRIADYTEKLPQTGVSKTRTKIRQQAPQKKKRWYTPTVPKIAGLIAGGMTGLAAIASGTSQCLQFFCKK